jgi:hypothetical protein
MVEYLTHTSSLAAVATRNGRGHRSASGGSSTQESCCGLDSSVGMVSSPRGQRRGMRRSVASGGVRTTVAADGPVGTVGHAASLSSVSAWHRCAPRPPTGGPGGRGSLDRWGRYQIISNQI